MPIDPVVMEAVYRLLAVHTAGSVIRLTGVDLDATPEVYCHRCGGPNIVWSAPSPLWNEVMRGGDINGLEPTTASCARRVSRSSPSRR